MAVSLGQFGLLDFGESEFEKKSDETISICLAGVHLNWRRPSKKARHREQTLLSSKKLSDCHLTFQKLSFHACGKHAPHLVQA